MSESKKIIPFNNFHERFRNKDRLANELNKSFEFINSSQTNNKLRTRPIQITTSPIENSEYVPFCKSKLFFIYFEFNFKFNLIY